MSLQQPGSRKIPVYLPDAPLSDHVKDYGDLPESLTSQTGHREFFDELVQHALPILAEFQSFRIMAFDRKKAAEGS
jgi:hypothetical protein